MKTQTMFLILGLDRQHLPAPSDGHEIHGQLSTKEISVSTPFWFLVIHYQLRNPSVSILWKKTRIDDLINTYLAPRRTSFNILLAPSPPYVALLYLIQVFEL